MEIKQTILNFNDILLNRGTFLSPVYKVIDDSLRSTRINDSMFNDRYIQPLGDARNASSIKLIHWPANRGNTPNEYSRATEIVLKVQKNPEKFYRNDFFEKMAKKNLSIIMFLDELSAENIEKKQNKDLISTIAIIKYEDRSDKATLELKMNWKDFTVSVNGKREEKGLSLRRMKQFDNVYFTIFADKDEFLNVFLKEKREKDEEERRMKFFRDKAEKAQREEDQKRQQQEQESRRQEQHHKNNYQRTNDEYNFDENFYLYLQVRENATKEEIKAAYYVAIRKYHADLNKGDPNANIYASKVNNAYETLFNDETRKKYDEYLVKVRSHNKSR